MADYYMLNINEKQYKYCIAFFNRGLRRIDNYNLYYQFKTYLNTVKKLYRVLRSSEINGSITRISDAAVQKLLYIYDIQIKRITELFAEVMSEVKITENDNWISFVLGIEYVMNGVLAELVEIYNRVIFELGNENAGPLQIEMMTVDKEDAIKIPEKLQKIVRELRGVNDNG